jgi:hypothetical protein
MFSSLNTSSHQLIFSILTMFNPAAPPNKGPILEFNKPKPPNLSFPAMLYIPNHNHKQLATLKIAQLVLQQNYLHLWRMHTFRII